MNRRALATALRVLGPLEARIMRIVWTGLVPDQFVVWDVNGRMPELAYTTVMTTVARLAEKGLLSVERLPRERAVRYRAAASPEQFLASVSRDYVDQLVGMLGDSALAAFEARLEQLGPEQRRRLRELAGQ
jgi:predicted transcriptional regulator